MSISDEEKRQIMNELARGNPEMQAQEPSQHPAPDEENFNPGLPKLWWLCSTQFSGKQII